MRKMSKLRQKLQISHSDVIRALRYLNRSLDFLWQALVDWLRSQGPGKLCVLLDGVFFKKRVSFVRWWLSCIYNKYNTDDSFLKLIEVNLLWVSACNVYLLNSATLNKSFVYIKNVHNAFLSFLSTWCQSFAVFMTYLFDNSRFFHLCGGETWATF